MLFLCSVFNSYIFSGIAINYKKNTTSIKGYNLAFFCESMIKLKIIIKGIMLLILKIVPEHPVSGELKSASIWARRMRQMIG